MSSRRMSFDPASSLMLYLLDTNIISDLVRNPAGAAAERLRRVGEDAVCTSIIVAAELRYGCVKRGSVGLAARVESILAELPVLPLEPPADVHYGVLRATLEIRGAAIGQNDLLIAAHGLALAATVVTANRREFERVGGLRVENWLEPAA
jgi:tRNA(fMet)-specific endonuclease VapC